MRERVCRERLSKDGPWPMVLQPVPRRILQGVVQALPVRVLPQVHAQAEDPPAAQGEVPAAPPARKRNLQAARGGRARPAAAVDVRG